MERMRSAYTIIARRDSFGRSRERWEENTTMDLRDLRVSSEFKWCRVGSNYMLLQI
jgi:hypothetical protein